MSRALAFSPLAMAGAGGAFWPEDLSGAADVIGGCAMFSGGGAPSAGVAAG
jgi:hypothetical protein